MSLGLTDKLKKSPKIKSITVTEGKKLCLKWGKIDGAEKYAVKRSLDPAGDFEHLTWVKKPEYTDEAVEENVTYWYKITAWKKLEGKKTSTKTSAMSAGIVSDIPAPKGVKLSAEKKVAIKLTWENIKGVDGCIISRRNDFHSQIIPVAQAEGNSFLDESIVTGQPYHYKLQYFKKNGESISYGNFSREQDCIHLDSGKILSVKRHLTGKITFSLRLVAGADGYILLVSDEVKGEYTEVKRSADGFDLSLGYKPKKRFSVCYYKVASFKKIGDKEFISVPSAYVQVKSL